jgi:DNA polymerase III subunit gamma/tau
VSDEKRIGLINKYRPHKLEDLVGQKKVASAVKGMITTGNVPPAILLVGTTGTGKTTTARLIARYLMCEKGTACGKCESCKLSLDHGGHPDYLEHNCASEGGKDFVKSIATVATLHPTIGRLRVIVLDEVHGLSPSARESLLKPLEEPPEHTLWILATTEAHAIKDSLKGRCNTLTLTPVAEEDLIPYLKNVLENEIGSDSSLYLKDDTKRDKLFNMITEKVALASNGYVRQSLSILDVAIKQSYSDDYKTVYKDIQGTFTVDKDTIALAVNVCLCLIRREFMKLTLYCRKVPEVIPFLNTLEFGISRISDINKSWVPPITKAIYDNIKAQGLNKDENFAFLYLAITQARTEVQRFLLKDQTAMLSSFAKSCLE